MELMSETATPCQITTIHDAFQQSDESIDQPTSNEEEDDGEEHADAEIDEPFFPTVKHGQEFMLIDINRLGHFSHDFRRWSCLEEERKKRFQKNCLKLHKQENTRKQYAKSPIYAQGIDRR